MNRIKEIWNNLKKDTISSNGLFKIRYSDTSNCDVYLGLKSPENTRSLILKVSSPYAASIGTERNLKGLKIEKLSSEPHNKNNILLNLILLDNRFEDIFDSLIVDIISNIINLSDDKLILKEFFNRIDKWQALFDKAANEGLNQEEQRGLFGELYFLRKWLKVSDKIKCLQAWVGPEKAIKDFQYSNWALEVKTSQGNNHQKVHISSERQLDTSTLDNLFLFHLSLDVQLASGETLHNIIESVLEILSDDFLLQTIFNNKLLQAGYFITHSELYSHKGYHIRQERFYKVTGDFPRIEENEVRSGVGDVKYSIIITNCNAYLINESEVFLILN